MNASVYPSSQALALNPIILHIEGEGQVQFTVINLVDDGQGGTTRQEVYSGQVMCAQANQGVVDIDISAVIQTLFSPGTDILSHQSVIQSQQQLVRHLSILVESGEDSTTLPLDVWYGGISSVLYKQLRLAGTDIFSERFNAYSGNFFFSSRDDGWQVIRRETELSPLFFIMPSGGITISPFGSGAVWESGTDYAGQFVSLDVQLLRQVFFTENGILPSLFDVSVGGGIVSQIAIEQQQERKDMTSVRYLSSLGTWERITFVGASQVKNSFDEDEAGNDYKEYDGLTCSFLDRRMRRAANRAIQAETDVTLPRHRMALEDMLQSDMVYLTMPDLSEKMVLPTIDELSWQCPQQVPERFTVDFQLSQTDSLTSPSSVDAIRRPGIFTPQFTSPFV